MQATFFPIHGLHIVLQYLTWHYMTQVVDSQSRSDRMNDGGGAACGVAVPSLHPQRTSVAYHATQTVFSA